MTDMAVAQEFVKYDLQNVKQSVLLSLDFEAKQLRWAPAAPASGRAVTSASAVDLKDAVQSVPLVDRKDVVQSIPLGNLTDVYLNKQTAVFAQSVADKAVPNHCFTLLAKDVELNLEASSSDDVTTWLANIKNALSSTGKRVILHDEEDAAEVAAPAAAAVGNGHGNSDEDSDSDDERFARYSDAKQSAAPAAAAVMTQLPAGARVLAGLASLPGCVACSSLGCRWSATVPFHHCGHTGPTACLPVPRGHRAIGLFVLVGLSAVRAFAHLCVACVRVPAAEQTRAIAALATLAAGAGAGAGVATGAAASARLSALTALGGASLPLHEVTEILLGKQTAVFSSEAGAAAVDDHCVSLASRLGDVSKPHLSILLRDGRAHVSCCHWTGVV